MVILHGKIYNMNIIAVVCFIYICFVYGCFVGFVCFIYPIQRFVVCVRKSFVRSNLSR